MNVDRRQPSPPGFFCRDAWPVSVQQFEVLEIFQTKGECLGEPTVICLMQTHVEFRSDRFPPVDGEDDEVNPGRYGKRLAQFVQRGLKERGIATDEPIAEDWGWCVPVNNDQFRIWVGCGNYEEYPDGFLCFIEPQKPFVRKWFKKIDPTARVSAVRAALDDLLNAEGIRDKKWLEMADGPADNG